MSNNDEYQNLSSEVVFVDIIGRNVSAVVVVAVRHRHVTIVAVVVAAAVVATAVVGL